MAILQAEDIDDLVTNTQKELNKGKFTQIAQRLQNYEGTERLFSRDKVNFRSGTSIDKNVMVDHSGAAKMVGLYAVDDVNVPAIMKTINVPWRHTKTDWAYDVVELMMNRDPAEIVDMVVEREMASMISMAELLETQWWGEPTGTTDNTNVFGMTYWIVANATQGFNGANHANFSAGPGSLDSDVYTRWKNYTDQWTNVTRTDLLRRMRRAVRQIGFQTPRGLGDFRNGNGHRYRIYMGLDNLLEIEEKAEEQNENLGKDIASMDTLTTFRGFPMIWASKLDGTTSPTNPIYMIDSMSFRPVCLRGNFFRSTGPQVKADQHNVREVFLDLTWNIMCDDRRRNAVLVTAT
jgi:hypothetical protein